MFKKKDKRQTAPPAKTGRSKQTTSDGYMMKGKSKMPMMAEGEHNLKQGQRKLATGLKAYLIKKKAKNPIK